MTIVLTAVIRFLRRGQHRAALGTLCLWAVPLWSLLALGSVCLCCVLKGTVVQDSSPVWGAVGKQDLQEVALSGKSLCH